MKLSLNLLDDFIFLFMQGRESMHRRITSRKLLYVYIYMMLHATVDIVQYTLYVLL